MSEALDLIRQFVEGGSVEAPADPNAAPADYNMGEVAPSDQSMENVQSKFVRPAEYIDWLKQDNVSVVPVVTDEGVDKFLVHLDATVAEAGEVLPLCLDTETCPKAHITQRYNELLADYEAMAAKLKTFPTPKKCNAAELKLREQAEALLNEAKLAYDEFLPRFRRAGLSIHDGQVRLLQIYIPPSKNDLKVAPNDPPASGGTVYVIDRWKVSAEAWAELCTALHSDRIQWFGHNVQFDIKMLGQHGMHPSPERIPNCSQLQAQALVSVSYQPKSLAERCGVVLGIEVDKRVRLSDWSKPNLDPAQVHYAAMDPYLTYKLYFPQREMILAQKSEDGRLDTPYVYVLMRNALPAVVEMETSGIGFDLAAHAQLAIKLKQQFIEGKQLILEAFKNLSPAKAPEVDNPGSNPQLNKWITHVMPDSVKNAWPKTDGGAFACGQDELKWIVAQQMIDPHYQPLFEQLVRWAEHKKSYETFGEGYAAHAREVFPGHHRLFCSIRTGGAETGRFSITDPALQTIPRESDFRKLFISAPGWVLVGGDYGQIEIRIAAVLSGDPVLLDAIRNGLDIHSMTALACFNQHATVRGFLDAMIAARKMREGMLWSDIVRIPEVLDFFKKGAGKEFRQIAKIAIFGLIYGQGPRKLQWTLFSEGGLMLTVDECRAIQRNLLGLYKRLSDWMDEVRAEAEQTKMCWTPAGRQYDAGPRWFTKSVNTPCQGGAAEVMLRALSKFPRGWGGNAAKLVLTVHDELIVEAREDDADRIRVILEDRMAEAATELFPSIPTHKLVEANIGRNWLETKETKA